MTTLKEIHEEWGEPAVSDYHGLVVVIEEEAEVDTPCSELPRVYGLYPDGSVKMYAPTTGCEYKGKYTAQQIYESAARLYEQQEAYKLLRKSGLLPGQEEVLSSFEGWDYNTLAQAVKTGRLLARQSAGTTWLTTRAAVTAAIAAGRLRPQSRQ